MTCTTLGLEGTLNNTMAALERFSNDVVPVLLEVLETDDRHLLLLALKVIREHGPAADKTTPVLMKFLRHDSRFLLLRCGAITALGTLEAAAKDAVPLMIEGLDFEDDFVRALSVHSMFPVGSRW